MIRELVADGEYGTSRDRRSEPAASLREARAGPVRASIP